MDYARITHSMPLCHGAGQASVAEAVAICLEAIALAGGKGNCSLGLNFSPYINEMETDEAKKIPTTLPNITTALETKSLARFTDWVVNVSRWAAEASKQGGGHVPVGAIMLDQEVFSDGASLDPRIRAGITQKNNAYYLACKAGAPGATIIQYNRGAWNLCPPAAPTCPAEFRNGTNGECTDASIHGIACTPDGYYRSWFYTLAPDEEGDSLAVSLYTVPELTSTINQFNRTVEAAAALGLDAVAPFICLGCGYMRDVMYPNGGSFLFRFGWDYDVAYSFLMGALVNEKTPWAGPKRPQQFGDWSYAKYAVFFPSIVDTQAEPCHVTNADSPCTPYDSQEAREVRLRHFVAYVRGGSLDTGNISQGRPECLTPAMMVANQSCLKVLYPPPPPPPPPLAAEANPLAGLPALPKPHYSWYRSHAGTDRIADNRATLIDYARITHSIPVCHDGNETDVSDAVAICVAAGGDCAISVDWSPYINEAEKEEKRVDPRTTTPNELASLNAFKAWARNVTRWAAAASKKLPGGHDIKIGAIGFDQEQLCGYCWSHAEDGTCNASTYDALTIKNDAYHDAAAETLPDAEIIWFSKGGFTPCSPNGLTCTKFGEHGVCEEKKEGWMISQPSNCHADGYRPDTCFSLEEKGDSYSVALYTVGEIDATMEAFNRTVQNAIAHGIKKVVPYVELGGGYQRDVLYPLGGSYLYHNQWDYEVSYSYLLGAMINSPRFLAEPQRFGPWSYAKSVVFYPSIVDTERDTCTGAYAPGGLERNEASPCFAVTPADARAIRLKHFVAVSLITPLLCFIESFAV